MNVVPLVLRTEMMDQGINSAVYVSLPFPWLFPFSMDVNLHP